MRRRSQLQPAVQPQAPRQHHQSGSEVLLRVVERSIALGYGGEVRLSAVSSAATFHEQRGVHLVDGRYVSGHTVPQIITWGGNAPGRSPQLGD